MYSERKFKDKLKIFMMFGFIPLFAFVVVMLIPFLIGAFMTFTNWNGVSSSFNFIGMKNYADAFADVKFWNALLLTLKYVIFTVIITNILAFGIAMLVTSGFKGQNFFRGGFFTTNLIGGVILGFIWQFIFSRVLVYVGQMIHLPIFSTSWLADPNKAFWALVIIGVWQNSGYMMLIYIAGLMGMPKSVLEASNIDGASKWQQLLYIKIPLLVTSFTISVFLTLQRGFLVYDTNLALTKGGPYRSTELIAMHVYNEAFLYQRYGSGQVKALILFVIVAAISVTQVIVMKKKEVES